MIWSEHKLWRMKRRRNSSPGWWGRWGWRYRRRHAGECRHLPHPDRRGIPQEPKRWSISPAFWRCSAGSPSSTPIIRLELGLAVDDHVDRLARHHRRGDPAHDGAAIRSGALGTAVFGCAGASSRRSALVMLNARRIPQLQRLSPAQPVPQPPISAGSSKKMNIHDRDPIPPPPRSPPDRSRARARPMWRRRRRPACVCRCGRSC